MKVQSVLQIQSHYFNKMERRIYNLRKGLKIAAEPVKKKRVIATMSCTNCNEIVRMKCLYVCMRSGCLERYCKECAYDIEKNAYMRLIPEEGGMICPGCIETETNR